MRRCAFLVLTISLILLAPVTSHRAAAATAGFQPRVGKILGIIPPVNRAAPVSTGSSSPGRLYYNGGPVMTTNKVYVIYWVPRGYTVSGNYENLINRYFSDLQAGNGKNDTVYASDTQYYQRQGNGASSYIQNATTFEGSVVDGNPLPPLDPVNCPDVASPLNGTSGTPSTPTACVTDGQIQQEISNVVKAKGWSVDNNTELFMFTAKNIGSCFSPPTGVTQGNVGTSVNAPLCSFQYFCAYHSSYFDSTVNPNSQIIYSNMPYAAETAGMPLTCDMGQYPNNDDADATINVASHEQNESITDPFGTGWWDSNPNDTNAGYETGDMCNFDFGTLSGPAGAQYSQTINGHHYLMQREWDNFTNSCVQTETPKLALTPNVGYPMAPFKATGFFFQQGEPASFSFTGARSSVSEALGSGTGDTGGHVVVRSAVPADAQVGTASVSGSGSVSGATPGVPFTVPSQ